MKKFLFISLLFGLLVFETFRYDSCSRKKFYTRVNAKYPAGLIHYKLGDILLFHTQKGYSFMIVKIENVLDTFYDVTKFIPILTKPKIANFKKIPIIQYDYIEYYPVFTRKEFVESGLNMPDSLFQLIPYD